MISTVPTKMTSFLVEASFAVTVDRSSDQPSEAFRQEDSILHDTLYKLLRALMALPAETEGSVLSEQISSLLHRGELDSVFPRCAW